MKKYGTKRETGGMFALCMGIVAVFIFAGVLVSFRLAEGAFSRGEQFVTGISFEGAEFVSSFKRAVCTDLAFCLGVLLFGAGFPVSFLPGVYILLKGFLMGTTVGLAARFCVMKKAAGIFFALFISNVLVLPLYILLFLIALKFSCRAGNASPGDKVTMFAGFGFRVAVFFGLMCLAELLQTGVGILVLK